MSATPSGQSELDLDGLDEKDAPLVAAPGGLSFGKDWKNARNEGTEIRLPAPAPAATFVSTG